MGQKAKNAGKKQSKICDKLAKKAASNKSLKIDIDYISSSKSNQLF